MNRKRIKGTPKAARSGWMLSDEVRDRYLEASGVNRALADPKFNDAHPDDRGLTQQALGAAFAFHDLSTLIESIEFEDGLDDVLHELEQIRIGFELGLQALDRSLGDRGVILEARSKGGRSKEDPEWHARCADAAKAMLATGTVKPHELAGKLSKRFPYGVKAIREALKKEGVK